MAIAFVYSPTETADFIARYGEDAPLRSHKFTARATATGSRESNGRSCSNSRCRAAGAPRLGAPKVHR